MKVQALLSNCSFSSHYHSDQPVDSLTAFKMAVNLAHHLMLLMLIAKRLLLHAKYTPQHLFVGDWVGIYIKMFSSFSQKKLRKKVVKIDLREM